MHKLNQDTPTDLSVVEGEEAWKRGVCGGVGGGEGTGSQSSMDRKVGRYIRKIGTFINDYKMYNLHIILNYSCRRHFPGLTPFVSAPGLST
jgi:hypothetical protein